MRTRKANDRPHCAAHICAEVLLAEHSLFFHHGGWLMPVLRMHRSMLLRRRLCVWRMVLCIVVLSCWRWGIAWWGL